MFEGLAWQQDPILKTVWPQLAIVTNDLSGVIGTVIVFLTPYCFDIKWYSENCSCAVFCVSLFQKPLLKWSLLGVSAVMTHCWLTSTLEKMSASQSWHHCAPTSKVTTSVFKCYDSRGREKQQHMTDNCPGPLIDHCSIKHKATAFCEFKTFCVH